jgi:hypothetical protein
MNGLGNKASPPPTAKYFDSKEFRGRLRGFMM